jgi:hypothetical protein
MWRKEKSWKALKDLMTSSKNCFFMIVGAGSKPARPKGRVWNTPLK